MSQMHFYMKQKWLIKQLKIQFKEKSMFNNLIKKSKLNNKSKKDNNKKRKKLNNKK